MYTDLRKKTNDILEIKFSHKRGFSFYFNLALSLLIFLNTLAIILNTLPDVRASYGYYFRKFEVFSVLIFSIEYILRVWSCVERPEYKRPFWGRLKFIFSPWGIIDFLAIFPFYASLLALDLSFIRTLRLLRIVRLFRFSRYFKALRVIQAVIQDKKEELVLSFSFILFLLLIISSIVFYIENPAQPDVYKSIPDSLWWGVNAMTTVGYGDMHPITPVGKLFGGLLAIAGVAFFALPTGILASGFAELIREGKDDKTVTCPHCEKEFRLSQKHVH
ncbi:MAG: voltage-gated potassium channel [Spirosomataceae bacterium]|jgi:voltage-gated potassium channel